MEEILEKTIEVLEDSKRDIFAIGESSRNEYDNIKIELEEVHKKIVNIIRDLDHLERLNRQARIRLMEVSRDFHKYTEADIKEAYEEAEGTAIKIAVLREKEEQYKARRRDLEKRLISLEKTIAKAEQLISRVSVIKDFLAGEIGYLSEEYDDLKEKQKLAIKVIQIQEEERRKVAREIHDGPAQSIANLVFRVELIENLLDKDINKAKAELTELKSLVRSSIQDIRKIIYDLRPMSLDDLGLIPTLARYIDKFVKETGIEINFTIIGNQKRLSNTYEVTIFRIVQEALNNIFKHARARSGKVRLEYGLDNINLLIIDDGIGFDPVEINGEKYGLASMKERCTLLGGRINIESRPKRGTIIKVILPLKGSEDT
ncbi:MAG: sensor histidine kinase [Halanaerobiales bacterium]